MNLLKTSLIHASTLFNFILGYLIFDYLKKHFGFFCSTLKGGYLDFSHLTELKKYIYFAEIFMKKKKKIQIIKN